MRYRTIWKFKNYTINNCQGNNFFTVQLNNGEKNKLLNIYNSLVGAKKYIAKKEKIDYHQIKNLFEQIKELI